MAAIRKRGSVRPTRWVLIPSAVAVGLLGLAGPAGASGGASVAAATLAKVVSVAGDRYSGGYCAVLSTGHVDCWGDNADGQLGNGTATSSDVPVAVTGITKATAVTGDESGSFCALLSTGGVACWGEAIWGQLGNGSTANSDVPVRVKNLTTAVAVTGGDDDFCALLSTGGVDCWGEASSGQLGNGSTANSDVPVSVENLTTAVAVTAGDDDFCALLSTGGVACWGIGNIGQLGNGTTTSSDVPVAVKTISDARAVTGDLDQGSFCAVLSTGGVDCWGAGLFGFLGDGHTTNSDVPVAATGISTATALAVGSFGFCALLSTGHVACSGYNGGDQLGNGRTGSYSDKPVAVKYITTATVVSTDEGYGPGGYGFCALLSTGHVACWGYGEDGELGDGTFSDSDIPAAVHAITNAAAVIGGQAGFCALLSTGHLACWGSNANGNLGNGTTTNSDLPVAVLAAS